MLEPHIHHHEIYLPSQRIAERLAPRHLAKSDRPIRLTPTEPIRAELQSIEPGKQRKRSLTVRIRQRPRSLIRPRPSRGENRTLPKRRQRIGASLLLLTCLCQRQPKRDCRGVDLKLAHRATSLAQRLQPKRRVPPDRQAFPAPNRDPTTAQRTSPATSGQTLSTGIGRQPRDNTKNVKLDTTLAEGIVRGRVSNPHAQIAQSVEQRIENPRVGSSILSLGTTKPRFSRGFLLKDCSLSADFCPMGPFGTDVSAANVRQSVAAGSDS